MPSAFDLPPGASAAIDLALTEDLALGDPTTDATVPPGRSGIATFAAREDLCVAGVMVAGAVVARIDSTLEFAAEVAEGAEVRAGATLATVRGEVRGILRAERVALNFLQRLSGVATSARRYAAVAGGRCRVVDTRKTTPGLRGLEKYAVRMGGCHNHRLALGDGLMIKDNHIEAAGGLRAAVMAALGAAHHLQRVEVEADTLAMAVEAVSAGARVILLDNFSPTALADAVRELRIMAPDVIVEASGGVNLQNLDAYCQTGVDLVSCGAIVHGARWVDIGLDLRMH